MKLKSFRRSTALIATLTLAISVATTVATAQTYTDLYNFDGTHGAVPHDPGLLAQGRDGNLYGTTFFGGIGYGVAFRITPNGALTVLYNFDGSYGSNPAGGLTLGTDDNFYGTTWEGGVDNLGTLFKITESGSFTTLYNFTCERGACYPYAPPIQGADGNFYGTTQNVAYKMTRAGTITLLGSTSQASPDAPLLQGTDGNFYGTTSYGGSSDYGTVFKMTPKGIVTTLYNFDGTHGTYPEAPVIQDSDGSFYGTTWLGGSGDEGVVFKLTPQGAITVLHSFPDANYVYDGFYS